MKPMYWRACALAAAAVGLLFVSGCVVDRRGNLVLAVPGVVVAPAPGYAPPPRCMRHHRSRCMRNLRRPSSRPLS